MAQDLVGVVVRYFQDNAQGMLFSIALGTLIFWWLGGFSPIPEFKPRPIVTDIYGDKDKDSKPARPVGPFTLEEVAQHDQSSDVWIIVRDQLTKTAKVYDVTPYVDQHPGGDAILTHAGGDSTEGFHGPQHPPNVFDVIKEYYIGDLLEHS